MSLLIQAQNDFCSALLSENYLAKIAVATFRAMVIAQQIDLKLPHLAGRQPVIPGPVYKGCGVIVNMPTRRGILPNIRVPLGWWIFSCDVVEQPEINFNPGGTMLTCEEVSEFVLAKMNNFGIEGIGLYQQSDEAISPIPDLKQLYPGCAGYRVSVETRTTQTPQGKSTLPIATESFGQVFFSQADEGAAIYYTLDGSFPGPGNLAGTQQLYNPLNPPNVGPGQTIRYAAYTPGLLGSDAGQSVIT